MECEICMEAFDSSQRRPKMFPCGHSACLACLQRFQQKCCPECRREFTCAPKDLPDNFAVLRLLEPTFLRRPGQSGGDCEAVAQPDRIEKHTPSSPQAALQADEVVRLQLQTVQLTEDYLPTAPRLPADNDDALKQAARVTPDLPLLEMLQVDEDSTAQQKAGLLQTLRRHRVRRLVDQLPCKDDPAWSLELLLLAKPHLEELDVCQVRWQHLRAVFAMPRLKGLLVGGEYPLQYAFPAELPPLPAHHVGLRWLTVELLPRETTFSLIRRHAGTLEELWILVGTPGVWGWPFGCDNLHVALGRCGLARLRRLVLWRPGHNWHNAQACPAQLSAVRGALPGVLVQCNKCDGVKFFH